MEYKAGRELDALVAEKVMGSKLVACMQCADWHLDLDVPNACNWSPSTDIAAAWEVVEKLDANGMILSLSRRLNGSWQASFMWADSRLQDDLRVEADTAPLTICKAALKAIEEA